MFSINNNCGRAGLRTKDPGCGVSLYWTAANGLSHLQMGKGRIPKPPVGNVTNYSSEP